MIYMILDSVKIINFYNEKQNIFKNSKRKTFAQFLLFKKKKSMILLIFYKILYEDLILLEL